MTEPGVRRRTVLKAGVGALTALSLPACAADDAATKTTTETGSEPDIEPNAVPTPVGMVRTSWATDPWAMGSYSYLPVGATPQSRLDLATPIGGRLFFAGEALDPDHPATVHGALHSGLAAAALLDETADTPAVVVVVGAGIAGAAAARALADAGHDVVVVE